MMDIKHHFEICDNNASWKYLVSIGNSLCYCCPHSQWKKTCKDVSFLSIQVYRPTVLKPQIYKELFIKFFSSVKYWI